MITSHSTGDLHDIISLVHANARTDLMSSTCMFVFCILVIFVAAGHMLWMKDFYAHLNAIKAEVDYQDDYITCRKHDRCSVRKRTKPKEANVQSEITDIDPAQKSCAKDNACQTPA